MREYLTFYTDGTWVDPVQAKAICGRVAVGSAADVDKDVQPAQAAA